MLHHRMSFYWSSDVGVFMFPGLNVNGVGPLIGLCLVLFIFSVIFEAFKIIQTRSKSRTAREILHEHSCPASQLINNDENQSQIRRKKELHDRIYRTFLQTLIFLFQTTLGYLLMLAVMVYNGYVFLLIILGFVLGYFLFGHIAVKINMENIRARKTHVICSPNCASQPTTSTNVGVQTISGSTTISGQSKNYKSGDTEQGYTNELAISSSSSSSLSTSLTQVTNLDREIDVHVNGDLDDNDSNVIQSCRL